MVVKLTEKNCYNFFLKLTENYSAWEIKVLKFRHFMLKN